MKVTPSKMIFKFTLFAKGIFRKVNRNFSILNMIQGKAGEKIAFPKRVKSVNQIKSLKTVSCRYSVSHQNRIPQIRMNFIFGYLCIVWHTFYAFICNEKLCSSNL